jgi:branched-chain amino acid transport system ATP-binding protein
VGQRAPGRAVARAQQPCLLRWLQSAGEVLRRPTNAPNARWSWRAWRRRDAMAGTISHGEQRQLEIAMTLATEPQVLLLDEPWPAWAWPKPNAW